MPDEFALEQFRLDVMNESSILSSESGISKREGFTQWMTDFWSQSGHLEEDTVSCFYTYKGHQIDAYNFNADGDGVALFLTLTDVEDAETLARSAATEGFKSLKSIFHDFCSTALRLCDRITDDPEAQGFAREMLQKRRDLRRIRLVILSNSISVEKKPREEELEGEKIFSREIFDLRRTFDENTNRQPIKIDFKAEFGSYLPCLKAPNLDPDYTCCLALITGDILFGIYEKYGPRLLERNVRSFLKTSVKTNKGIRLTIENEPDRFLAYNNGISATAEDVEFVDGHDGACFIRSVTGFQIVNGGQTTAMIYHAGNAAKKGKTTSQVPFENRIFVPAKITMVKNIEKLEEIVVSIARYANTQNKISESDLSSNEKFHTALQDCSRRIGFRTHDGEVVYWYYERARAQWEQQRLREQNKKAFLAEFPKIRKFDKTDVARFEHCWRLQPIIANQGKQKSFLSFTKNFVKSTKGNEAPVISVTDDYYRRLVGKIIFFRAVEKIVRGQHFKGHWDKIENFTVSYLCFNLRETDMQLSLERIVKQQRVADSVALAIEFVAEQINTFILASALGKNVGEWCKEEACWKGVQNLGLTLDIPVHELERYALVDSMSVQHNSMPQVSSSDQ